MFARAQEALEQACRTLYCKPGELEAVIADGDLNAGELGPILSPSRFVWAQSVPHYEVDSGAFAQQYAAYSDFAAALLARSPELYDILRSILDGSDLLLSERFLALLASSQELLLKIYRCADRGDETSREILVAFGKRHPELMAGLAPELFESRDRVIFALRAGLEVELRGTLRWDPEVLIAHLPKYLSFVRWFLQDSPDLRRHVPLLLKYMQSDPFFFDSIFIQDADVLIALGRANGNRLPIYWDFPKQRSLFVQAAQKTPQLFSDLSADLPTPRDLVVCAMRLGFRVGLAGAPVSIQNDPLVLRALADTDVEQLAGVLGKILEADSTRFLREPALLEGLVALLEHSPHQVEIKNPDVVFAILRRAPVWMKEFYFKADRGAFCSVRQPFWNATISTAGLVDLFSADRPFLGRLAFHNHNILRALPRRYRDLLWGDLVARFKDDGLSFPSPMLSSYSDFLNGLASGKLTRHPGRFRGFDVIHTLWQRKQNAGPETDLRPLGMAVYAEKDWNLALEPFPHLDDLVRDGRLDMIYEELTRDSSLIETVRSAVSATHKPVHTLLTAGHGNGKVLQFGGYAVLKHLPGVWDRYHLDIGDFRTKPAFQALHQYLDPAGQWLFYTCYGSVGGVDADNLVRSTRTAVRDTYTLLSSPMAQELVRVTLDDALRLEPRWGKTPTDTARGFLSAQGFAHSSIRAD